MITTAQIKAIAGSGARSELVAAVVNGWTVAVQKAKLTTKNRACHFLAQIMTETGGLTVLSESGAYRAPQIMKIFGVGHHSAKVTDAEAKRIAALPVAQRGPVLFNRVYGVGNPTKMREFDNTGANDGWLYRGGGMMQATGKSNYAAMEKKTGLPLVAHPELLHNPDSAFMAAYLEWSQDGRCNAAADRDDVVAVRRIINGGTNGIAECRAYLAKAKKALVNYGTAPTAAILAEPETDAADVEDASTDPSPGLNDGDVGHVDPDLLSVQSRLKRMNYNPGIVDGNWGGMAGGAIAGFLNDRHSSITAPTSPAMFAAILPDLDAELTEAENEEPPFVRPVSDARAAGGIATVAKVAPEVVPTRRNFLAAAWASVLAFFSAIWTAISSYVSAAWDFFTDHKDSLPSDPSFLQTAWGYVTGVPVFVWIVLVGITFAFFAFNALSGMKKITASVQTGARQ